MRQENIANQADSAAKKELHTINSGVSIRKALESLNRLSGDVMTLFVVDDDDRMVGTLTDGDVRRGLIAGNNLDDCVSTIMHRDFKALKVDSDNFRYLRKMKESRIDLLPSLDSDGRICGIVDLRTTATMLPLDAVLMAGGRGERLRPHTLDTPKPLLKIGDKAIIDYNIDELARNGIDNIFVTVNYLHEQIEEHFMRKEGNVKCVLEPKRMGTIGSISLVDGLKHDNVLLMNSDILTTISFEDMYATHIDRNAAITIAVIPYSFSVPFAILKFDGDYVKGLEEKPTYNYFANAGIYIIRRDLLSKISKDEYLDAPTFIESVIADGEKVVHFPINGTWIDIGSPDDFRYAQELMTRPI